MTTESTDPGPQEIDQVRPKRAVRRPRTTNKAAVTNYLEDPEIELWQLWQVDLQIHAPDEGPGGKFAAAIPRTEEEIRAMLTHRQPTKAPDGAVPIEELTARVLAEVSGRPFGSVPLIEEPPLPLGDVPIEIGDVADGALAAEMEEEGFIPGWATFKRDDTGLYYEGRCIRGHLKDCALQVAPMFAQQVPNFRSKLVNKVFLATDKIYLGKTERDGYETRFIQVMTRQGRRSSIKNIDYVIDPLLSFRLRVLNDGVITERHLRTIFAYGGVHGIGQERSQDWGRYRLENLARL